MWTALTVRASEALMHTMVYDSAGVADCPHTASTARCPTACVLAPVGARDGWCHGVPVVVTPEGCSSILSRESTMPSANRISTPVEVNEAGVEGRYASLGDYAVSFETFKQDMDPAPLFAGLPDDRCQCPHWGVVTAGQLSFRWPDHEETFVAGDAYYAPPGHLPLLTGGTTVVEFSPTAELEATMAVIQKNLAGTGMST
jgi:hypothetical protein